MRLLIVALAMMALHAASLPAQEPVRIERDSVSAQFVDADLRNVIQALARYLPKPVLIASVPAVRVSLETPTPIPRAEVLELLRGMLLDFNLELAEEATFFRVRERPRPQATAPPAPPPAQPGATRGGATELFVIRLRHARAADVAATVAQLFGATGALAGSGGLSTGTLSDELRRSNVPPAGGPAPAGAPERGPGTRNASLAGAVTIVPDEITNSLLVRATREDFAVIQNAVNELDIRPLQVLIEVLIVEARRDNLFSLSADLFMPEQTITGDTRGSATVAGGGLGDLVVRLLSLTPANITATIRAAESRGNVSIVSRPVLVASNNVEARLLVGAQRPFVQVSRSLPTDQPQRDQVVQYRDVGTRLVVRPTINHDGYVSLQIQQEVNAATEETQFDAPVISTRETATRVLVRDGQTVVLGGLRDSQRSDNRGGIPLISRIPILGGLFGHSTRRLTDTELFLFITPRILRNDADADSVTARRLPPEERP